MKLKDNPDFNDETLYPLAIEINGETLNLKYRALTEDRVSGGDAESLSKLIAEWDAEDVQPTLAYFKTCPLRFRRLLIEKINADYFPNS